MHCCFSYWCFPYCCFHCLWCVDGIHPHHVMIWILDFQDFGFSPIPTCKMVAIVRVKFIPSRNDFVYQLPGSIIYVSEKPIPGFRFTLKNAAKNHRMPTRLFGKIYTNVYTRCAKKRGIYIRFSKSVSGSVATTWWACGRPCFFVGSKASHPSVDECQYIIYYYVLQRDGFGNVRKDAGFLWGFDSRASL